MGFAKERSTHPTQKLKIKNVKIIIHKHLSSNPDGVFFEIL